MVKTFLLIVCLTPVTVKRVWKPMSMHFNLAKLIDVILFVCFNLLSLQAQNEIKSLVEASKYLEDQKTKLIQKQQAYLKELSLLTGM